MHSELRDWIALRLAPGIGSVACKNLLETFGSPEAILNAPAEKLAEIEGLASRGIKALQNCRDNPEIERELEKLTGTDIRIITWSDPEYPQSLKNIFDPPPYIYIYTRKAGG